MTVVVRNFIFAVILLVLGACFGSSLDRSGTVYGYEKGRVKTVGGGYFWLGAPSSGWRQEKIHERAVLFRHGQDHATIGISSWCKGAVDDRSQEELSGQAVQLLVGGEILALKKKFPLSNGGHASVTALRGQLDGEAVYLKSAVIKRRGCVFDFTYVTHPEKRGSEADFDEVVRGFRYGRGPSSL